MSSDYDSPAPFKRRATDMKQISVSMPLHVIDWLREESKRTRLPYGYLLMQHLPETVKRKP